MILTEVQSGLSGEISSSKVAFIFAKSVLYINRLKLYLLLSID